ncbi:amidase [Variovorax paradoxus B4]|uniref:Amidase n=1 Tax=Variovorax paradoxus B4 TaxID=1246301 RepID=T1XH40_VARPD|nr:amidase family protein [Variovorax paradoxus]AGU51836.1 amidase [Variovorax paradoxus B4]
MQLWQLEAADLAQRIKAREVSCVEAVRSSLARLDAVNPQLNAVADCCADEALNAAALADAALANGEATGPLHGVPVTIKVNVDQRGHATTNGVEAYRSVVATEDSPVVENLQRAGAIVVGRTNTPAFSMRWFTDNAAHGRTLNPHNADVTPGGSSGGAAAAVAVGIGAIAHGNDQGGSIRYPAYACGVYGLRPSFGRVPAFNPSGGSERPMVVQLTSVQGPLARSVRDLRLAFAAMAQRDVRDPWWAPAPLESATSGRPISVALCTELPGYACDPEVADALQRAARLLESAGYRIEPAQPPRLREAADLWLSLTMADSRLLVEEALLRDGDDAIRQSYRAMDAHAPQFDMASYMRALAARTGLMREWALFLQRHPLLLMPVSWRNPFPVDADQRGSAAMREILDAQSPLLSTAILGLPGLSVPMGMRGRLSTGVQLVSDRFREDLCLAAAEVLEAEAGPVAVVDPA